MIFYSSPRKLAETNLASLLRVPCNTVCGLLPGQNRKSAFADKNRGMSTHNARAGTGESLELYSKMCIQLPKIYASSQENAGL